MSELPFDRTQVWTALEPLLVTDSFSECELSAIKPFILAMPDILKDILGKPVTLKTITDAKIAFVRHIMDAGFLDGTTKGTPASASRLRCALGLAVAVLEIFAQNVQGFLNHLGVSEDDIILGRMMGLSPENAQRYRNRALTVADVVATQPSIIAKITD